MRRLPYVLGGAIVRSYRKNKMDKPNMVGKRFGRLVVLEETVSKHNRSRWVCRCECGKTCIATGKTLREGKKSSCGCLRREASQAWVAKLCVANTLPDGEASCNQLYSVYRWQAEKRKFEFSLTKDDFKRLTKDNCFYCGIEPRQIHHQATCKTPYTYNGIDRQNNSLGYTIANCVTCCGVCNDMKRTRTAEDFVNKCEAVVIHQNYKRLAEMTSPLLHEGQQ